MKSQEKENDNTITPVAEKNSEKKSVDKVYEWACRLTTEQGEEEYFWVSETTALRNRLMRSKGNMIAVIGLQGSGKTALRQALHEALFNAKLTAYSIKWVGRPEATIIERIRDLESGFLDDADKDYFDELFGKVYEQCAVEGSPIHNTALRIVQKLRVPDTDGHVQYSIVDYIKAIYGTRFSEKEDEDTAIRLKTWHLLPFLEKAVGSKRLKEIKNERLSGKLQNADLILIDLPDYDRSNIRQMSKDLTSIQEWWENVFTSQVEGGYTQSVSIVIFFQKELFIGHFFMGKLDVYELQPLTPKQLLACYETNFKSTAPFTEEALSEICTLSRGIFRRFKKYVRICLDHFMQSPDANTITPENVKQWITLDQLVKDMELELMTIFPKEREHRVLSVKLLRLLRERGPLTQSQIIQEIFDGAEMKASRILNRLESWNYIKRERKGKDKVVSLL